MTVPVARILLVDADQTRGRLLTQYLAQHAPGMEVYPVTTFEEYLEHLESQWFDLALADYRLLDTPGGDLLLQTEQRAASLPVVFLVDEADENAASQLSQPGPAGYILRASGYPACVPPMVAAVLRRSRVTGGKDRRDALLSEIARIGEQMRMQLTLSAVLDFICNSVHDTLGWKKVVIRMRDGSGAFSRPVAVIGTTPTTSEALLSAEPSPVTEWYADQQFRLGRAFMITALLDQPEINCPEEIKAALVSESRPGSQRNEWRADDLLIMPLDGPSGRLGTMLVTDPVSGSRPALDELQGLEIFANQVATAIESAHLYRQLSLAKGRFQLLDEIGHQVGSSLNLSHVLREVLSLTISAMEAERGSILVLEEGQQVTYRILSHELGREESASAASPVLDDGLSRWVLDHQVGVLIADVHEDERWYTFPDERWPSRSVICVPLKVRQQVRAVMTITHNRPKHFDEDDLHVAEAIADRVAWAVENAWLYRQTDDALRSRVAELEGLNSLSAAMGRSLDLDEILENAMPKILAATGIEGGAVHLWDHETQELVLRLQQGLPEGLADLLNRVSLRDVVRRKSPKSFVKPVITHLADSPLTKRYQRAAEMGYLSFIGVPLQARGSFLGAIILVSKEELGMGPEMSRLLIALSHQLGMAVLNAQLFGETRSRADQLATIHAVTATASSSLNPKEIVAMVLERTMTLTGLEIGGVYFQEPSGDLILTAERGTDTQSLPPSAGPSACDGIVGYVVRKGKLAYTTQYPQQPYARQLPSPFRDLRTAVGIPLRAKGRVFGVVFLASERSQAIEQDVLRLLEIIGDEIGVAIENARLFTEVRQAEEHQRAILDSSIDAIISGDAEAGITGWSAGAEHIFGWSRDEALGQPLDFVALEDTRDQHRKGMLQLLQPSGFISNYVSRARHKDGHSVDIEVSASLLKTMDGEDSGYTAVIRDITARLQRERLLQALNEAASAMATANTPERILDAAGTVLLRLGIQCVALMVDAEREDLSLVYRTYDCPAAQANGSHLDEPVSPFRLPIGENETYERVIRERVSLISHDPPELIVPTPADEEMAVRPLVISAPLIVEDTVIGVLSVSSPSLQEENVPAITAFAHQLAAAWHKAELFDALQESMGRLKEAQARLVQSEKMSAVGQLVSGVAHELNNPLTAVMGYSQLLETANLSPRARDDLGKIRHAADRCSRIVKDLLTFAREYRPERSLIQVNELIEQTIAMRSYQLRVQNVHVIREYDPDLPSISGDPHRLQEVFLNLLINAEQSMTENQGRGTLKVRTLLRTEDALPLPAGQPPALDVASPAVRIEFEDDGGGIPPDIMEHIFDPFFTTREVGQGTGLGLSICYGIIGEHYGRIWAEDLGNGSGARFVIELPVPTTPTAAQPSDEDPGLYQPSMAIAKGKRILVVDDEELVALVLGRMLERMGCHVVSVYGGEEALARLSQEEYDAIITDLKMPGMSGRELYSEFQRIDRGLTERVIFTTGDVITPGTAAFIDRSGRPSIPKPFTSAQVAIALKELLETQQSEDDSGQHHQS